jgi:hypothetical protein
LSQSNQGLSPEKPNVILYLPPGPLFKGNDLNLHQIDGNSISDPDTRGVGDSNSLISIGASPQHVLASTTSALVVTVIYRLGEIKPSSTESQGASLDQLESNETHDQALDSTDSQVASHKYPTPVHDTLVGFDWIQTNLQPAQLAVFGTHIGGSLALMLALTEARSLQAVAALEPICDWPSLDDYCTRETKTEEPYIDIDEDTNSLSTSTHSTKPKRQRKKPAPPDLLPLLEARSRFFSTPERCFDPFASPVLFLRSAGRDVPRTFPRYLTGPEYPVPVLRETRKTTAAAQYHAPDGSIWDRDVYPDADGDAADELAAAVTRRRKALSRWPPYGLDYGLSGKTWSGPGDGIGRLEVVLPWVRVFARDNEAGSSVDGGEGVRPRTKTREVGGGPTVLARQADEMVSVMQRACFWGREKSYAERKVTLSRVSGVDVAEKAGGWFHDVFRGTMDDID